MQAQRKSLQSYPHVHPRQGTSIAFKNMIVEILKENSLGYIHVFALSNEELQKKNETYQEIVDSYNLIAVIGNVHIDVDCPFLFIYPNWLPMIKRRISLNF